MPYDQRPTPERCMEAFHLQRTQFELIVERKQVPARDLDIAVFGKLTATQLAGEESASRARQPFRACGGVERLNYASKFTRPESASARHRA